MTLLTDPDSKPELDEVAETRPPDELAGPSLDEQLRLLTDEQIVRAFPTLTKPRKLLEATRVASLMPNLLLHLLLAEEVRRSGGDLTQLAAWRRQRWGSRVEQQFVLQRQRFQRISYYQLVLKERGEAMEYYYQLSNQEIQIGRALV